jgi:hypothetical protein
VEHFGQIRFHSGALSGGQHYDVEISHALTPSCSTIHAHGAGWGAKASAKA